MTLTISQCLMQVNRCSLCGSQALSVFCIRQLLPAADIWPLICHRFDGQQLYKFTSVGFY